MLANCLMNLPLAYMDPASGSLILQILLGGIAGVAVAVKMFWGRITSFLFGTGRDSSRAGKSGAKTD